MKTETMLLIGGAAVLGYIIFFPKTKTITITAYDGTSQTLTVDGNLTSAAQVQIATFFAVSGTMQNSLNPAADEATLLASLRGAGFSTAATAVDGLYQKLLSGAQLAAPSSGYSAGAYGNLHVFNRLRPMIDYGRGPGR